MSSWRRRHSPSWDKKKILVGEGRQSDSSQDFEFGWRSHSLRLECFYLYKSELDVCLFVTWLCLYWATLTEYLKLDEV